MFVDRREIRFRVLLKEYFNRYSSVSNINKINWLFENLDTEVKDAEIVLCQDGYLDGSIDNLTNGETVYTPHTGIANSGIKKIEYFMDEFCDKALFDQHRLKELDGQFEILIDDILSKDEDISQTNFIVFRILRNHF